MAEKMNPSQDISAMIEQYTQDLRRYSQIHRPSEQPGEQAPEPAEEAQPEVAYLSLDTPVAQAETQQEALVPCECETLPEAELRDLTDPVPVMAMPERVEFEEVLYGSRPVETDEIILDGSGPGARFSLRTGGAFYPQP